MKKIIKTDVEINREALDIVLRSFPYILENYYDPRIIDRTELGQALAEVESITKKLKSYSDAGQDSVVIPMDFSDWADFANLIVYAPRVLPSERVDDANVLESLSD